MVKDELRKKLKKFDFDGEPIIRILYTEKNMQKMIDFIDENPNEHDPDVLYVYSAKLANIPCKPVNKKIKELMERFGVRERKTSFIEESKAIKSLKK